MEPPPIFKLKDRRVCHAPLPQPLSEIHPEFLRAGAGPGVGLHGARVEFTFVGVAG